jgi:hypothetical protein
VVQCPRHFRSPWTYVGTVASGGSDDSGTGDCQFSNESFTFTAGKGNTFKAVPPALGSGPNRICVIIAGPTVGNHVRVILPNVSVTGRDGPDGRATRNLAIVFGPAPR